MRTIALIVAAALLAACETADVESRGQMRGGVFSCQSNTLPSPTLLIHSDGAYELRWRDTQDRTATGWIEQAGEGLRPTSGPLEGALLSWSGDGLQAAGTMAITACRALPT